MCLQTDFLSHFVRSMITFFVRAVCKRNRDCLAKAFWVPSFTRNAEESRVRIGFQRQNLLDCHDELKVVRIKRFSLLLPLARENLE